MFLELTSEEMRLLASALDSHLHRLLEELTHADDRAFKAELKEQLTAYEAIRRKLAVTSAGDEIYG